MLRLLLVVVVVPLPLVLPLLLLLLLLELPLFFLLVGDRAGDPEDTDDEAVDDEAMAVDDDDFCLFRLFLEGDDPRCL